MVKVNSASIKELKQKLQVKEPWNSIIIFVLNVLIAIPLFIILHQNLKDPNWPVHIDRILLFIVILVTIQLVLRLLRTVHIPIPDSLNIWFSFWKIWI